MASDSEIKALINLVDDSDEAIYFQVRDKLLSYGSEVIPYLEEAWEVKDFGEEFQTRIEDIIHEIQFKDVLKGLKSWVQTGGKDLMTGILLLNKHHFPELDVSKTKRRIADIAEAIKASMHETLSRHQQIVAINRGIFAHFQYQGDNEDYYSPSNSILSKVIERRKGNPLMISILYMEVARQLGVPVVGVNLPRHFIVGVKETATSDRIQFYLSPFNKGTVLTIDDIETYLKKLNLPFESQYFDECTNIEIVSRVLLNLMNSYMKMKNKGKLEEVNSLYRIVKGEDL